MWLGESLKILKELRYNKSMTRTTLAVVASLITSTFAVEFDYDKYDQESFNTSSYFKNIKASYYHQGDNTGKAMLAFKNEAIVWDWKDSVCSSVSQYFMDGVGEYQFSGTYKCSFKPKDVMNVAELFFMEDGAESFKKKYGAKADVKEDTPVFKNEEEAYKFYAKKAGVTVKQLRMINAAMMKFYRGARLQGKGRYSVGSLKQRNISNGTVQILFQVNHVNKYNPVFPERNGKVIKYSVECTMSSSLRDPNMFTVSNLTAWQEGKDKDGKSISRLVYKQK